MWKSVPELGSSAAESSATLGAEVGPVRYMEEEELRKQGGVNMENI